MNGSQPHAQAPIFARAMRTLYDRCSAPVSPGDRNATTLRRTEAGSAATPCCRMPRDAGGAITSNVMIDRLREATDALNAGDPAPLVSLMDDDVDWRGVSRGFLWWKRTPS
jgi:hypothetical protein